MPPTTGPRWTTPTARYPISNVPGAYANGYDVMIAQRICDANGWELEVVSTAWDSLTPALQSGTIDVAIAASP